MCILEKDLKTYNFIKIYLNFIENGNEEITKLDNKLQYDEIIAHLYNNKFSNNDQQEMINWINNYGRNYRHFLNSVKYFCIFIKLFTNINTSNFEFLQYCEIINKINNLKQKLSVL